MYTYVKKNKIGIFLIVVLVVNILLLGFMNFSEEAKAYQLLSWDLVDNGKHLDYDGQSKYISTWYLSTPIWNEVNNVIRPDSWKWTQDVEIGDYYEESTIMAYTSSAGKIRFNDFQFSVMSLEERQKIIMHEIGHALGLDENNNVTGSIMKQGRRSQTWLNEDDINGFTWLYDNKY